MISDMKMPVMSGMDLFTEIQQILPHLPVIFLTAYGTIPDAVTALKKGVVDYISKPFDGKVLVKKINDILSEKQPDRNQPAGNQPAMMDMSNTSLIEDGFYWGKSPGMKELYRVTQKVAASQMNVLILGESGVGKECIAKYIHRYSLKKNHPYIVVDCGSTPAGILESELFGHMKGSFTHAIQDKTGLIEAAHKGTLFLDEIGNISQDMQSRLLRFLEDKQIRRVGAIKEIHVDCRVLSATNADLTADIEKGNFRQDLYYRLKGITLTIPPLRERKEDILALANLFLTKYSNNHHLPRAILTDETLDLLENYTWPGNIRELKNALEAGIVLCKNNTITPLDLQLEAARSKASQPSENIPGFSIGDSEKETIIRALKKTNGVQKNAAELLNISRRSIHYKIKKYDIKISECKR